MSHPSDSEVLTALKGGITAWGASPARTVSGEPRTSQHDRNIGERVVLLSMISDAVVIAAAMVFSFWLRFHTGLSHFGILANIEFRSYAGYIAVGTATMLFTLAYRNFYDRGVVLRFRRVGRQILESSLIWVIGFLSISLILKFQPTVSRFYVALCGVNVCVGLLISRGILDWILHHSNLVSTLRQKVLFIGWSEETERLSHAFATDPASPYELVGCVSPAGRTLAREPADDRLVLGTEEDLAEILERREVDIVMLADMSSPQNAIMGLANLCEKMLVQFKVVPSYFQILVSGLHLETVSGIPILGVSRLPLDRTFNIAMKRFVDVAGALVGLFFSLPLIAIFGAIVYLESPGPILYRQRRMGRNGRDFFIYKIRSMKLNAEANGKVGWSTKDDPRRLRIGSFMRKLNIDEVPQFWNVLKGEMSLVGPRPERPELIRNFKHEIPHYNARHHAKPGITGWAQVNGLRGDTDLGERIKCDLWYLENWTVLLDFHIMLLTFIKRDNAA